MQSGIKLKLKIIQNDLNNNATKITAKCDNEMERKKDRVFEMERKLE